MASKCLVCGREINDGLRYCCMHDPDKKTGCRYRVRFEKVEGTDFLEVVEYCYRCGRVWNGNQKVI
ncbi:MAG: hypothetical protein ACXQTL_02255 [Methanosarcinales archaeon]